MKEKIAEKIRENKADLLYCLAVGFLLGLVSYGFIFLSSGFGHDAMVEFNSAAYGDNLKIQAGRVFVPAYRLLTRTSLTIPWLIGLFSLLWFSLAVFFLAKLLGLRSRFSIALAGGLLITNPAICALAATYIHDMDSNVLALLCAVLAVYLWNRSPKGFLAGIVCVCLTLGIYQSYLSIIITLIIFVCLLHLLDGQRWQKVLLKGGKGIGMILGGGILYLPALKIIPAVTGVPIATNGYNTLDKMTRLNSENIMGFVSDAYRLAIQKMVHLPSGYPQGLVRLLAGGCFLLLAGLLLWGICLHTAGIVEKIMAAALLAVMPFAMNLTYVLAMGASHDLMYYAIWMIYLFVLMAGLWFAHCEMPGFSVLQKGVSAAICLLLSLVVLGDVQLANMACLRREMNARATFALMNRATCEIEHLPGYVKGETPVVFIGKPDSQLQEIANTEPARGLVGGGYGSAIGTGSWWPYDSYIKNILQVNMRVADQELWNSVHCDPAVQDMPCYPEPGSVILREDGTAAVKFAEE